MVLQFSHNGPTLRIMYRIGVPDSGVYAELLNSDRVEPTAGGDVGNAVDLDTGAGPRTDSINRCA